MDHDWKVCRFIPSVVLICDIPDLIRDSFLTGTPYVTTKEKVFQKSDPFRHATELTNIIRDQYSNDGIVLDKDILLIYSDGGGDYVTFYPTKVSLICLFLQTDVGMLIALRCCPMQSWVNPAERVMSVLNIAIQNCALEREVMNDKFEKKMKTINSMSHLRNASTRMTGLKEAFNKSMQPVINNVNARFESMKLKDDCIKCKQPASEEAVQQFKNSIHLLDSEVDLWTCS